jgi:hypothetical protein
MDALVVDDEAFAAKHNRQAAISKAPALRGDRL